MAFFCFWITLINVYPALALFGVVFLAELMIVYIAWAFFSALNIFLRDVKNSAVFFGMYNEELKDAYAEKTSK